MTHDVWAMLLNYPAECLDLDCIVKTFVPYGRFLVWNKDMSDRARILVKIRAYNVDTLPMSVVVLRNLIEDGNTDSWTCPLVLLARQMLGGNPHPIPPPEFHGFWHDQQMHEGHEDADNQNIVQPVAPATDAAPAAQNNATDGPNMMHDTPHQSPSPADQYGPPADPTKILNDLVNKYVPNAAEFIEKLDDSIFKGTTCKLVETNGPDGVISKCILQFEAFKLNAEPSIKPKPTLQQDRALLTQSCVTTGPKQCY
jgi:hypothetical protein